MLCCPRSSRFAFLTLAAAGLLFVAAQDKREARKPTKPVTVFIVRHAEKDRAESATDPGLTKKGETRALALRRLLSNAGVTHLFATEFKRTRSTLAPLAKALDLEVEVVKSRDRAAQVAALRALPAGSIAVVAGHSNTITKLARDLGGQLQNLTKRGWIPDDAHDRLFVLTLPTGKGVKTQTIELRYGEL